MVVWATQREANLPPHRFNPLLSGWHPHATAAAPPCCACCPASAANAMYVAPREYYFLPSPSRLTPLIDDPPLPPSSAGGLGEALKAVMLTSNKQEPGSSTVAEGQDLLAQIREGVRVVRPPLTLFSFVLR